MKVIALNNTGKAGVQVSDIWNALLSGIATPASIGALIANNVGYSAGVEVSDNLLHSNDPETTESGAAYVKTKEILILSSGTYRIKFSVQSPTNAGNMARGRIYKNGVAFGTEQGNVSVSYVEYSEDLYFAQGDLCQMYQKNTGGAHACNVKEFRLYGDVVGVVGANKVVP